MFFFTPQFRSLRVPAAVILVMALVRCGEHKGPVMQDAEDAIPVKLQRIQPGVVSRPLQYSGLIASNSEARLSFKIGGMIAKIAVKEGDRVSKGQLLASLDLTEIDAQVRQAAQNVEKSRRDEGRIKNLYEDTVASLEQLQNTRTQLTVAMESLRIAQFNRQYAQIRAAADGTIVQKLLNEGEFAPAGTAVFLFNGADKHDWVVRFGVSDRDWAVLRLGDQATVTMDAYPEQIFSGTITKMAEGADPASGTYPIEVQVSPAGHKMAPGLFCSVQLKESTRQTITLIPAGALAEGDGKTGYVYTLNPDGRTVTRNPVRIAFLQKDQIAISSGLENVTEIIAEGVGYLTPGAIVKPVK